MTRDNHSIVIVETQWDTQIPIPSVILNRFKFEVSSIPAPETLNKRAFPSYSVGADLLVNRNAFGASDDG